MRIAIYHNLPSGGSKRALFEMTRRLQKFCQIDAYTLSSADLQFCDIRPFCQHYQVYPFSPYPLLASPLGRANQILRTMTLQRLEQIQAGIARDIDRQGYDLVFVHHCIYGQSPAVLSMLKTPAVYYCAEPPRSLYEPQIPRPYRRHSSLQRGLDRVDPFIPLFRNTLKKMDLRNTRSARLILTNSAYSRESIYRIYGVFPQVCYLGVDRDVFRRLPVAREDYILTTGAVRPDKGFDFIIQSLALIPAAARPRLVVIGNQANADELAYLRQLAADLGIKTEFKLLISDEDLVLAYNRALLTVYAPVLEPFGLVPLESMACGTPVVGVREGGVRESVLHNQTGLLTERIGQDFAGAVSRLLHDAALRQVFSENGIRKVQNCWDWDMTISQLESAFRSVAG